MTLIAHDVHDRGGMERALAELIRRAHRTVDFTVVAATLDESLRPLVRWVRVPVPRRPFPLKFACFYVLAGLRLTRLRGELRHSMGAIVPQPMDLVAVQFCHAGFWELERAQPRPPQGLAGRLNAALHRALSLAAERWSYSPGRSPVFLAASEGIERELREHYAARSVRVVPNGVDGERFRPGGGDREALRAELGVPGDRLVALFVGGDWHRKGLALAIEALAGAESRYELWIVGGGDRQRFQALAERHGVADRVRFLGRRPDVERVYRAADVFVFPTLYEAFPLVALEAAASGLPIVATPVNGIEELLAGGEAGVVVRREAAELTRALRELGEDEARRAALGRAARRRAESYTWEAHARGVLEAYRLAAGRDYPVGDVRPGEVRG